MIGQLLILGFTLGLDNFRTAILLGALRLTRRHAVQVALVFGFWDMMAPLVGILAGDVFAEKTDLWPMNPDDMPSTEPDMDGPIDPEAEPKPGDLEWL